jgi:hypothetical protein
MSSGFCVLMKLLTTERSEKYILECSHPSRRSPRAAQAVAERPMMTHLAQASPEVNQAKQAS